MPCSARRFSSPVRYVPFYFCCTFSELSLSLSFSLSLFFYHTSCQPCKQSARATQRDTFNEGKAYRFARCYEAYTTYDRPQCCTAWCTRGRHKNRTSHSLKGHLERKNFYPAPPLKTNSDSGGWRRQGEGVQKNVRIAENSSHSSSLTTARRPRSTALCGPPQKLPQCATARSARECNDDWSERMCSVDDDADGGQRASRTVPEITEPVGPVGIYCTFVFGKLI